MKKKELEIVALSHSISQTQNYAIVLGEVEGNRRLPIVIGGFEAQSIAVAMEGMLPSRPLTHDLIKIIFTTFEAELKEVIISNLVEGIFFARLVCVIDGRTVEIDSRTSDAMALAVRFACPIYTYEFILDQAGILVEETEEDDALNEGKAPEVNSGKRAPKSGSLEDTAPEELEKLLQQALEQEDYEKAAQIRDEINRRKAQ